MGSEIVPAKRSFWPPFLGALLLTLFVGLALNFIVGYAAGIQSRLASILIELIPGALLAAVSIPGRRHAFWKGVLAGAAIVATIGGLCGLTL